MFEFFEVHPGNGAVMRVGTAGITGSRMGIVADEICSVISENWENMGFCVKDTYQ